MKPVCWLPRHWYYLVYQDLEIHTCGASLNQVLYNLFLVFSVQVFGEIIWPNGCCEMLLMTFVLDDHDPWCHEKYDLNLFPRKTFNYEAFPTIGLAVGVFRSHCWQGGSHSKGVGGVLNVCGCCWDVSGNKLLLSWNLWILVYIYFWDSNLHVGDCQVF